MSRFLFEKIQKRARQREDVKRGLDKPRDVHGKVCQHFAFTIWYEIGGAMDDHSLMLGHCAECDWDLSQTEFKDGRLETRLANETEKATIARARELDEMKCAGMGL